MKALRTQRGAVGALVLAILAFAILGVLATFGLSRVTERSGDRTQTRARLDTAVAALEAFAGAAARLPCPANPTLDTGLEDPVLPSASCTYPEGTIPWQTLGMRRDDAFDAWGRKISYRVYTGNAGSLTQPGGMSMVNCDTQEPTIGARTGVSGGVGGLCTVTYSTRPERFLQNKGFTLNDMGQAYGDVAFVVVSHGATGLGAYTASGARLALPAGDERGNTQAAGAFTIKAFSDVDTAATMGAHFDDLLAYRRIEDLARRAGLNARDWPDDIAASLRFDATTVGTAAGSGTASPGSVGTGTLDFGSATVTGGATSGTPDISFDSPSGNEGLGVAGSGLDFSFWGYVLPENQLSNYGGEFLRIDLDVEADKFAMTLNDFGIYSFFGDNFTERVEVRFYNDGAAVGSPVQKAACSPEGSRVTLQYSPGVAFDRVEIQPIEATGPFLWLTGFLVAEITACKPEATTCTTSLAATSVACP